MDPLRPRSPYAASKAGGELLAWAYHISFGLPLLVTRGSNTYGPYQFPEKIIPLFITNALDRRSLPVYGDGTAVRDYLYVDDHCRAIDTVLHGGVPGQAYNIGTGVETDGNTVAKTVIELTGNDSALIERVEDRLGHDYRYALDTTQIAELGWEPKTAFRDGLAATVRWYRENEGWWRPLKSSEFWQFYNRNYRPAKGEVLR
jgi:dTDP-glucose 4,6-dehydratase